jgi:hypothetical protein
MCVVMAMTNLLVAAAATIVALAMMLLGIFLGARLVRPAVTERDQGRRVQESRLFAVVTLFRELIAVLRSLEGSRRCGECDPTIEPKTKRNKSGR